MRRFFLAALAVSALAMGIGGAQAAKPKAVQPGEVITDCRDCPEMVVIPPGSNQMGSTPEERIAEGVWEEQFGQRESPRHLVTIAKPFALGKYEVTRGQYAEFVKDTKRPDPAGCGVNNPKTDNSWATQPGYSWRNPGYEQTDKDPASCISWNDANDFAVWLAHKTGKPYRLASEAEWEYAARGGTSTTRYWGNDIASICDRANIMTSATFAKVGSPKSGMNKLVCTSDHSFTVPVGSFAANPYGVYDMLGNVWEFVADCYHKTYEGAPADGSVWSEPNCEKHFLRGGAFHSEPFMARPATRGFALGPDAHAAAAGFRIARDLS